MLDVTKLLDRDHLMVVLASIGRLVSGLLVC